MKRLLILLCVLFLLQSLGADPPPGRVLHVYDEVNENSTPYIGYFSAEYARQGIAFDTASVAELGALELGNYDTIVIHGMVMAFSMKSPVRDWLKTRPRLDGKKVYLFVTANRWFLDKLYGQLTGLLEGSGTVDAISMATKDLDTAAKQATVQTQVARLR